MSLLPKKNTTLKDYYDLLEMPLMKDSEFMKTDIYEKDNKYYIEMDMPGIKKENIKINYDNGYLNITAINDVLKESHDNYIRRERFYGEVKRSFYIGIKKEQDIKASSKDGILTISFPKVEHPNKKSKNIIIE